MTVATARGAKRKCDVLFSQLIRSRGACEKCGSTQNLQCAHIISRRYNWTRTLEANAFCLCAACHRHFTDHPVEFGMWTTGRIGADAYDDLRWASLRRDRFDWHAELERLKSVGVNQ